MWKGRNGSTVDAVLTQVGDQIVKKYHPSMDLIRKWLQRLGLKKSEESLSPLAVETPRTTFQARYHNFELLLTVNNKALQITSEIEEARKGDSPFGMSFIRSHCPAICANALRMIESMNELAPGKYLDLYGRVRSIESRISEIVRSGKTDTGADLRTIPLRSLDITRSDEAGSKLANWGEVHKRVGVRIPNRFVISSRAFPEFMSHEPQAEIDRLIQASPPKESLNFFCLAHKFSSRLFASLCQSHLRKTFWPQCQIKIRRHTSSYGSGPGPAARPGFTDRDRRGFHEPHQQRNRCDEFRRRLAENTDQGGR